MKIFENKQNENIEISCNRLEGEKWLSLPDKPELKDDTISVFGIHVSGFSNSISALIKYLNEEELSRSEKYHQMEDKQRFITSRSILKILISKYLNKLPREIKIEIGANKKPCLPGTDNLEFNLSHSNDWIVIVISDKPVGIDLEKVTADFNFKDVLALSFSEKEKAFIESSNSVSYHFFEMWTRKEALAKATSKGIDDDFPLLPSLPGKHVANANIIGSYKNWTISSILLDENYIASLAYESDNLPDIKLYKVGVGLFS